MPKNIVLLSDGTGNSAAKLFKTNVWRLYGALDLHDPKRQIAHYSDGVGTSSFKPLAMLGGVFGFGLKRNVLDLYQFACRTYQDGDQIFGFGFSRGAFTIRVVAGFIANQGLVPYHGDEAQLARDSLVAYRAYRARFNVTGGLVTPLRRLRDWVARGWRTVRRLPLFPMGGLVEIKAIRFIGVWDTVAAYGGPIEEVTRGIDHWLWPLSMPDRFISAKVTRACHAVALDDERNAFWPVLWDENECTRDGKQQPIDQAWSPPAHANLAAIDRQRLSQVWFAGMHSCVGGGYAQDGLSYLTLAWMMDRAEVYGLLFNGVERARLAAMADAFDKLNDSRHGLSGYYRYKPRKLVDVYGLDPVKPTITGDLARVRRTVAGMASRAPKPTTPPADPLIHESVFHRIAAGLDGYSPIVLPETYRVTTQAGAILPPPPAPAGGQALARVNLQEHAWNLVWLRRVVYFATVLSSVFLAAMPLIVERWPGPGATSLAAALIPAIDLLAGFLPGMASPWLDAFRAAPGLTAIGVIMVAAFLLWGASLQQRIATVMLRIWRPMLAQPPPLPPNQLLFGLRTSPIYQGFFYALTHWILPTVFAALIVCLILVGANRVLLIGASSAGLICRDTARDEPFDIRSLCHRLAAVSVEAGKLYRITLETDLPWRDGPGRARTIDTGPAGFGWKQMTWTMAAGVPLRQHLGENWLAVILRVGRTGRDEQVLRFGADPSCARPAGRAVCTATFRAGSSGDVFVFVNDAVIALPGLGRLLYANNRGVARVTIGPAP